MSHAKEPPRLPEVIVDEAGNSPKWLPLLGLGLLALAALLVAVHQAIGGSTEPTPAAAPAAEQAAPPAAGAPAEKPAPSAPAPSDDEQEAARNLRKLFD